MDEIIRTTKTHSFTRSDISILVATAMQKFSKESGIFLKHIRYLVQFDLFPHDMSIIILKCPIGIQYGTISVDLGSSLAKNAHICSFKLSSQVPPKGLFMVLMKAVEEVLSKLEYESVTIQTFIGVDMFEWFEQLGYKVDETTSNDIRVILSKQLS